MSIARRLKLLALGSLKGVGAYGLVGASAWRRRRLLILAYHGISLDDEHAWAPGLFMPPAFFRSRLELLKKSGCRVLPLGEALALLYAGTLPERSVVITFDDGLHDFGRHAAPLLEEFGFPVTLYLTTFYADFNRPVFDVVCAYLLWKGRARRLDLGPLAGVDSTFDLSTDGARAAARDELFAFARREGLSAEEKDRLAADLAARLGVDYDALLEKRILRLLTPDEVGRLAAAGVDVQLHTHRHRTPKDGRLFRREIDDNRARIREMTGDGERLRHFCYPSGVYEAAFLPWLDEAGVTSATTCDPGIATPDSHRLLLPRLLDTSLMPAVEFEGWLAGAAALLPRRRWPARAKD